MMLSNRAGGQAVSSVEVRTAVAVAAGDELTTAYINTCQARLHRLREISVRSFWHTFPGSARPYLLTFPDAMQYR